MKLWRLTRAPYSALDGEGAMRNGSRYAPPGRRVVSLASEAGLAVLVVLRYLPRDLSGIAGDYVLGWTEVDASPVRIADQAGEEAIRAQVADWVDSQSALIAAVRSKVLPEADVVLLNPEHPAAALVPPLVTRPFDFAKCLHIPPMLASFAGTGH
ncbi:MAG: RES family NAD+ phosphorylase [Novosphingobium sp.]